MAMADLESTYQEWDTVRTGNPNHKGSGPGGGQFTSGGGSSHGKHWARRQRRKKKLLAKLRQQGHAKIAKVKERQRGERKSLRDKQRAGKTSYADRRTESKELAAKQRSERQETIKELKAEVRQEVAKIKPAKSDGAESAKTKELKEWRQHVDGKIADAVKSEIKSVTTKQNAERKELMGTLREERSEIREGFIEQRNEAIDGLNRDFRADQWSVREQFKAGLPHAEASQELDKIRQFYRQNKKDTLTQLRSDQKVVLDDHRAYADKVITRLDRAHAKSRQSIVQAYKEVRKGAVEDIKGKVKGGDRGQRSAGDYERGNYAGVQFASSDVAGDDQFSRLGEVRRASSDPARIGRRTTHKASSAEAILQHCLKRRGWTSAFRYNRLTGKRRLALLEDVRQYGRAWLRHEAEVFFGRYIDGADLRFVRSSDGIRSATEDLRSGDGDTVRPDDEENGRDRCQIGVLRGIGAEHDSGRDLDRSLSDRIASPLKRWFGRMRSFAHELIVAGALAMMGPDDLTSEDQAILDRNAQVQVDYLDRFEREIVANPPPELRAPDTFPSTTILVEPPPSVAQVIARAESYADSVWQSTQIAVRAEVTRQGIMTQERLILGDPATGHCSECPQDARLGWQPIGTMKDIGDRECEGWCHCHFVYREKDDAPEYTGNPQKQKPAKDTRPKGGGRLPDMPDPNDQGGGSTIPGPKDKGPPLPRHPRPVQPHKPKPGEKDYGEDAGGPWLDANGEPIEYETL